MTDQTQNQVQEMNDEDEEFDIQKLSRREKRLFHKAAEQERQRVADIKSMFTEFRLLGDHNYQTDENGLTGDQAMRHFIDSGTSLSGVRKYIINRHVDKSGPLPQPKGPIFPTSSPANSMSFTPTPVQSIQGGKTSMIEHFGNTQRAYEAGLWIRGALLGDSAAKQALAMRGMTTLQQSGGGVLIPDVLASGIISLVNEYGIARRYARQWPMSSGTLSIPRRASGVSGGYIGETAELPETQMTLDAVNLVAKKYACMVRWSTELAEDAVIDIAGLLAEEIAREFARAEDAALFLGDGTSTYGGISGILPAIVSTAGAVTAASGHDTFGEVDNADLAACVSRLPSWARQGASWFVSPTGADQMFQRIGMSAGGVSMLELGGILMQQFMGFPIIVVETMPAADDMSGAPMLLFGRMDKACAMGVRREMNIRVDDLTFARFDQVALYASERYDVVCHDIGDASHPGALVALVGAS